MYFCPTNFLELVKCQTSYYSKWNYIGNNWKHVNLVHFKWKCNERKNSRSLLTKPGYSVAEYFRSTGASRKYRRRSSRHEFDCSTIGADAISPESFCPFFARYSELTVPCQSTMGTSTTNVNHNGDMSKCPERRHIAENFFFSISHIENKWSINSPISLMNSFAPPHSLLLPRDPEP